MTSVKGQLTVVGDTLLDVDVHGTSTRSAADSGAPVVDEERVEVRPGGAGLAATLAARDGWHVTLVTALSTDSPGDILREALQTDGIAVLDLGLDGTTPHKVRIFADGAICVRLDRSGASQRIGPLPTGSLDRLGTVLVSDYGRGMTSHADVRRGLAAAHKIVWDPHERGAPPLNSVTVATPNEAEAARALGLCVKTGPLGHENLHRLVSSWGIDAACVTCGVRGAVLCHADGVQSTYPAPAVEVVDVCGAGDRFSVTMATELDRGRNLEAAVELAVLAATAYVNRGPPAGLSGSSRAPEHLWAGTLERLTRPVVRWT